MSYSFHPEAQSELEAARDFYDDREFSLGSSFIEEVRGTIEVIIRFPDGWPRSSRRTRRCICTRFPYSVIYRHTDEEVTIFAIAHHSRKPGYWKDRVS